MWESTAHLLLKSYRHRISPSGTGLKQRGMLESMVCVVFSTKNFKDTFWGLHRPTYIIVLKRKQTVLRLPVSTENEFGVRFGEVLYS